MSAPESAAPAPVRRYLTLVFSDLCGSTRLAAELEAEYYADILGRLRAAYQEILPRHGGTVVRVQGDGLLAIFGYPEAREDDGCRAVDAALELHAAIRRLRPQLPQLPSGTPPLRLHTGVHSGLVLMGDGDLMRGRFELMGNAPNVAARLSDTAEPDEVLVSDETLGPDRGLFTVGRRRQLLLPGLPGPFTVLSIGGRAAARARLQPPVGRVQPLIGRTAEAGQLAQAMRDARAGRPQWFAISAAAGLGKTRLAEDVLARCAASGFRVHRGYCEGHLGTRPLQPFLQILKALFDIPDGSAAAAVQVEHGLQALSPEVLARRDGLLAAMSIEMPTDANGGRRGTPAETEPEALADLFAALSRRQPQAVFIDDWQWADDASHRVLDSIGQLAEGALLVVLATREGQASQPLPQRVQRIELQPLSSLEASEHIARLLPGTNPFLVNQICQYAGGSPLLIEELCHCVAGDVEVRRSGRLRRSAAWLNVLIASRVARLPEAQADLVRRAAVIGNVIPGWLLETITDHAVDDAAVQELAALDLVFPSTQRGALRFKHALTRECIYDAVGLHQRRALHLQVARALQQHAAAGAGEDHCEALAYHLDAAGASGEAAHYAEQAGDRAMAACSLDRAQAQYRAALAALERDEPSPDLAARWNDISQRLGLACVFDASRSDLPLFERALALANASGNDALIGRAAFWLGYILYALGDTRLAVQQSERALRVAASAGDDRLAVQVRATLGQAQAAAGQYASALPLLDEAIAVKRAHRSHAGQSVGLGYSLAVKGTVLGDRGDFAAALACFGEALQVVDGVRHQIHAAIHALHAAVLLWQGDWPAARRSAEQACNVGEQVRSLFMMSMGRAAAAYAEWMIDPRPEAMQALQDATNWLLPRGIALFRSLNHGWLADALARCGRGTEARAHAAQALLRWRAGDGMGAAMACRAIARLDAGQGRPVQARHWLARAQHIASCRESAHEQAVNALCEAEIALCTGGQSRAAALLDATLPTLASLDMRWHLAQASLLLQQLAAPGGRRAIH